MMTGKWTPVNCSSEPPWCPVGSPHWCLGSPGSSGCHTSTCAIGCLGVVTCAPYSHIKRPLTKNSTQVGSPCYLWEAVWSLSQDYGDKELVTFALFIGSLFLIVFSETKLPAHGDHCIFDLQASWRPSIPRRRKWKPWARQAWGCWSLLKLWWATVMFLKKSSPKETRYCPSVSPAHFC